MKLMPEREREDKTVIGEKYGPIVIVSSNTIHVTV